MEYDIDDTIMGGLQMYTESEFMDMSLASRITRINQEIEKLSMWERIQGEEIEWSIVDVCPIIIILYLVFKAKTYVI